MATVDLSQARKYVFSLLPEAGRILREHFSAQSFDVQQKEGVDFTTQADLEVDELLRTNLARAYPQTQFLTEETAPDDYAGFKTAELLWVIDPLDGTINFSRHHPNFATSVALVSKGQPVLGVIYLPLTGDIYWAQADCPDAHLNDAPIHVSTTAELRETVLACDWAWSLEKRRSVVGWLERVCTHVRQIKSMGSAVADLASLAQGRIDAYLHSGLKPWDVAATALLIRKAGGTVTSPSGADWDVFDEDILATNGVLHERILTLLEGES